MYEYFQQLSNITPTRFSINNIKRKSGFSTWQNAFTQKLLDVLKIPTIKHTPKVIKKLPLVLRRDYTIQKIYIRTEIDPVWDMPVYVLRPLRENSKPLPILIILQVHGPGATAAFGDIDKKLFPHINKDFSASHNFGYALEAVKKGFMVLVPESRGVGELRDPETISLGKQKNFPWPASYSCAAHAGRLLHLGRTLLGMRTYDVLSLIAYLKHSASARNLLGNYQPKRIGVVGHSGGAPVALMVSLFAKNDIRATCLSGYVSAFKDSILAMQHCACNYVPDLGQLGEMRDFIALLAPNPLMIAAGKADEIFPFFSAKKTAAQVEKIYSVLDAKDNFIFYALPSKKGKRGHRFPEGSSVFDWFEKYL